jgi:hypothetical protein
MSNVGFRGAQIDADWYAVVEVEIAPNPNLSPAQREMVEREFGMHHGRTLLKMRKALLFYLLGEPRLLRGGTLPVVPSFESPVRNGNHEELVKYLESMRF